MIAIKRLRFDYSFQIEYQDDVNRCYYTIKCVPKNSARQKIDDIEIQMIPESKPEYGVDSLGNKYIWGCNEVPHKIFNFRITGSAVCGIEEYEEAANANELMIYRHPSKMTAPGKGLLDYFEECKCISEIAQKKSPFEVAKALSKKLHTDYIYEKDVTDVGTTAEEAFQVKKGVCQDFSHILITLLRLAGCSARYVTGFMIGEGATHAWVEVASDGRWYGIDPTNNMIVSDSHIKIGVGRDASECQINRGIMHGGGKQKLDSSLSVTEQGFGGDFIKKGLM